MDQEEETFRGGSFSLACGSYLNIQEVAKFSHEFVERILVAGGVSKGGRKRIGSISILTSSGNLGKNAEGSTSRYSLC